MKYATRPIGVHVRLHNGLEDVIEAVQRLSVQVAQSFLITESNDYIFLKDRLMQEFVQVKKDLDFLYFVHAAYWSGLHDRKSKMFASLQQETEIAQDLQSNGIVIHVGARKAGMSKKDRPLYVAECVNLLTDKYPDIKIILENSPHAGRNFGGDLQDFQDLMHHVEKKDRVGFCIDTAHAFVFGYDIAHEENMRDFLDLISQLISKDQLSLLHFNDSQDRCGSYIDKHEVPGDGLIGKKALKECMNSELFKDIPIIIELPGACEKKDEDLIAEVQAWEI